MLDNAQINYDFYETPKHHSENIFNDFNPRKGEKLKVIDICCGLGSLIDPWYNDGHLITLIELNDDFTPILKQKYPNANIISKDFLTMTTLDYYDVYLCNPPFNTTEDKNIYVTFFCKILNMMMYPAVLYFISPKMFYKDQMKINIEMPKLSGFNLSDFVKENNTMPAYYYYEKFNVIELDSNGFKFDKTKIRKMVKNKIISENFISDENLIIPYFEFRFLGNIFDFKMTNCKCGLFKVNK